MLFWVATRQENISQVMRPSGYASNLEYNFDNGTFWVIIPPHPTPPQTIGCGCVDLCDSNESVGINPLSPQWHMITTCCQVSSWLTGTVCAVWRRVNWSWSTSRDLCKRWCCGPTGLAKRYDGSWETDGNWWKLYVIRDAVARDEWILVFRLCSQKTKLISTKTSIKSHEKSH